MILLKNSYSNASRYHVPSFPSGKEQAVETAALAAECLLRPFRQRRGKRGKAKREPGISVNLAWVCDPESPPALKRVLRHGVLFSEHYSACTNRMTLALLSQNVECNHSMFPTHYRGFARRI